jgi:Sugar (and other) transporter
MVSEIFPSRTRGRGISLAVLMNFRSNALVTFAFSPLTVIIYIFFKNYIMFQKTQNKKKIRCCTEDIAVFDAGIVCSVHVSFFLLPLFIWE